MHRPANPRHPFKALVAVLAMAALVHGLCAHADTGEDDGTPIAVAGARPLHAACPDVDDDDLAEELVGTWEDDRRPATNDPSDDASDDDSDRDSGR